MKPLTVKLDEVINQLSEIKAQQQQLADLVKRQGQQIQDLIILTSSFTTSLNLAAKETCPNPLDVPLPVELRDQ